MKQDELITIPFVVHEADMAREERKQIRLLLLSVLQTVGVIICLKLISASKRNN